MPIIQVIENIQMNTQPIDIKDSKKLSRKKGTLFVNILKPTPYLSVLVTLQILKLKK